MTSIDSYRNARGLDARLLGNLDLEHTIGIARLDRFGSYRIGQGETAQEGTDVAFDVFEADTVNALPRRSLATNGQCAVFGEDLPRSAAFRNALIKALDHLQHAGSRNTAAAWIGETE